MKIRLWIFLVVVGVLLVVIHEVATGGMTILSDIENDPAISDEPIWYVGAIGFILFFSGAVLCFVERIQRSQQVLDARTARVAERQRKAIEILEN